MASIIMPCPLLMDNKKCGHGLPKENAGAGLPSGHSGRLAQTSDYPLTGLLPQNGPIGTQGVYRYRYRCLRTKMPSLYALHSERTLGARPITWGTLCEDFPVL